MKLSHFKILITFFILTLTGYLFLSKLAVYLIPEEKGNTITVNYTWFNSSAKVIESEVTSIFEGSLSLLKGIKKIESMSAKNQGSIILEFNKSVDIDNSRFEVSTLVRQIYPKLPTGVSYPRITINNINNEDTSPFLVYNVYSTESSFHIQNKIQNLIIPKLNSLKGVNYSRVNGANSKEYVLEFKNIDLIKLGITRSEISRKLKNYFERNNLGYCHYSKSFLGVTIFPPNFNDWRIPIKNIGGRIIYLTDIINVVEKIETPKEYFRINGNNALSISIFQNKNANAINLKEDVDNVFKLILKELPEDYLINLNYDSTIFLKSELDKVYTRSSLTILILLFFMIVVTRNLGYIIVTILTLISNLGISFLLYFLFDVQIHLYSLAGITISLGLIIDNCIVMIDHINGQKNRKILIPILASTLTTLGALIVVFLFEANVALSMTDFISVLIINLSVSLVTALYLIPSLLKQFSVKKRKIKYSIKRIYSAYYVFLLFVSKYKKTTVLIAIFTFGLPFFLLPKKIEKDTWYKEMYNQSLGSDWFVYKAKPILDKYTGGTFRLFNRYVFENSQYEEKQETKIHVLASMEKGATLSQMNDLIITIERYLGQFDEIRYFISKVKSPNFASIEITFKEEYSDKIFPYILKDNLSTKVSNMGGVDWKIYGVGDVFNGSNVIASQVNFLVKVKGYNYSELNKWADSLKESLKHHPRISDVFVREKNYNKGKLSFEYNFDLDKEKLKMYKLDLDGVYNELANSTLNINSNLQLNINGYYSHIRFASKESKDFDVWNIKNNPMGENYNTPIFLKDLIEINKVPEEENIYKENQEYVRYVEFLYTGALKTGSGVLDKKLNELEDKLPLGYKFEPTNIYGETNENGDGDFSIIILLILFIIYTICSILFEDFRLPLVVISLIPISFIGVFLTFYLFNFNFDQGGWASFILLSGITVNSSIYLLNDFNKFKKMKDSTNQFLLYLVSFKNKVLPISLTILSTIIGFIPFIYSGQDEAFWFTLGVGSIGGLLFSIIGLIVYLPILSVKFNENR